MRFAFDVDGVILEMPQLFCALTQALRRTGHTVYIVTDFDEKFRAYREKELSSLNIEYDELVITSRKSEFFKENGIDFAFDDDPEYYDSLKKLNFFAFCNNEN